MNRYRFILFFVITCVVSFSSVAQKGARSFMQITYISEKGTERSFKLMDEIILKTASGKTHKGQLKHIGQKGISVDNEMITDKVISVKYPCLIKCFSKIDVARFKLGEPTYE